VSTRCASQRIDTTKTSNTLLPQANTGLLLPLPKRIWYYWHILPFPRFVHNFT
jgi:hypothetical protein